MDKPFQQTSGEIPFDKLKRPDPILLFDDVMLYEDELADNGISILSVKIRVMPERLLILQRFFMRLDGVLFRLRDTRLFIEFETGEIVKQYQAREDTYANVRSVSLPLRFFSLQLKWSGAVIGTIYAPPRADSKFTSG